MHTRLVTVSRQLGSGAEDIARGVASTLGFRYLDQEVIERAATEAGVPPAFISEAEHNQPFRKRMLEAIANNPGWAALGWYEPVPYTRSPLYTSRHYRQLVEEVIRDVAREGNAVILGHGAQVILASRWDTIRVLVTGDVRLRALRLRERLRLEAGEAEKAIAESDLERRCYFERIHQTTWLSPALYDLCINTDRIPEAQAVCLITRAACSR